MCVRDWKNLGIFVERYMINLGTVVLLVRCKRLKFFLAKNTFLSSKKFWFRQKKLNFLVKNELRMVQTFFYVSPINVCIFLFSWWCCFLLCDHLNSNIMAACVSSVFCLEICIAVHMISLNTVSSICAV